MKFIQLLPDLFPAYPELSASFKLLHKQNLERIPGWSLQATRRQITVSYWFNVLINHYGVMIILSSLLVWLLDTKQPFGIFVGGFFPAAIITFGLLFLSIYWPTYHLHYLPHLDTCVETYKGDILQGIQRCKKEQYSVVTLMLIEHVHHDLAGLKSLSIDQGTIGGLARKYGVSIKSIQSALQLVVLGQWDRNSIRKRTETLNDFDSARAHFELLKCDQAITLLDHLQQKRMEHLKAS